FYLKLSPRFMVLAVTLSAFPVASSVSSRLMASRGGAFVFRFLLAWRICPPGVDVVGAGGAERGTTCPLTGGAVWGRRRVGVTGVQTCAFRFFETESIHLLYPLALWINDGLMAIFFLLVGLEIKREVVGGALATPRQAALPILCAIGGAVIPAGIYVLFNQGQDTLGGWGIPMATDIAFALAIFSMLGDKVPVSLKIFLSALAIIDDLIDILVIAFFYSAELSGIYLLYAGGILLMLFAFNRMGIRSLVFYLVPGVFIWNIIPHSGIHATIARVLAALAISFPPKQRHHSPLLYLEHALVNPVNFVSVPIFALAKMNIRIEEAMIAGRTAPLGIGI